MKKLSKNPITATVLCRSRLDAQHALNVYEDRGNDIPEWAKKEDWAKTLALPVELYFTFSNVRRLRWFLTDLTKGPGSVDIITHF